MSTAIGKRRLQSSRILGVASVLVLLGALAAPAGAAVPNQCAGKNWISAWGASPTDAAGSDFAPVLAAKTARVNLSPTITGSKVRVVLTNRFGADPVTIDDAFIGRTASGATLVKNTNKRLRFAGSSSVTIPPGEEVTSDALNFKAKAFQPAAVSVAVDPSSTAAVTHHFYGGPATFVGAGDLAATEEGSGFNSSTIGRPLVSALQVQAGRRGGTVAGFGDSITEGFIAYKDGDFRYTDFLGRRLADAPGPQRLSVLNAGISGNKLLSPGSPVYFGPSALSRFDADVVDQAGVTDVIIMLGLNDLGGGAQSPELIAGLTELVQRAKAAGINPLLGTLTPVSTQTFYRDQSEINDWIRSQDLAAVVDFESAVADPGHPRRLLAAYDGGDHAHLSAAGYERMAQAVDLADFRGRVCN